MKREVVNSLWSFLVEFVVYALLVAGYYFVVLRCLGGWLSGLFANDRRLYAWVALGFIIGQGVALDAVTGLLLAWVRQRTEGS